MKRFSAVLILLVSTETFGDFSVNVERTKTLEEVNILTLNDLAVGESGFVHFSGGLCRLPGGKVGTDKYTELESERSGHGTDLQITRLPEGKVSISFPAPKQKSMAGMKPPIARNKNDTLKNIATSLAKLEPCDKDYLVVESIEGASSLSELIDLIKSLPPSSGSGQESSMDTTPSESSEPIRTWIVSEDKSKFDDSTNVTLMLSSNEKAYGAFRMSDTPTLVIRCKDNKTELYVDTGRMLDSETATMRLNSEKAYPLRLSKSTDGRALFFPSPIRNIKKMWKHEKMAFRFTPYNSGARTVTFNIGALKTEIAPLRKACHW